MFKHSAPSIGFCIPSVTASCIVYGYPPSRQPSRHRKENREVPGPGGRSPTIARGNRKVYVRTLVESVRVGQKVCTSRKACQKDRLKLYRAICTLAHGAYHTVCFAMNVHSSVVCIFLSAVTRTTTGETKTPVSICEQQTLVPRSQLSRFKDHGTRISSVCMRPVQRAQ
jgi:hypothetical protein